MNISEKLTQQQLRNILMGIMEKGNVSKDLSVKEVVDDIKQQLLTAILR